MQPHSTQSITLVKEFLVADNTQVNKGIHIKAEGNNMISVYATNYVITSAGGYSVLPLYKYEDFHIPEYIYFAFSTETDAGNAEDGINGVVLLTAGYNDTTVTITPSQNVSIPAELTNSEAIFIDPGHSYTVKLDSMQTLLLHNEKDLSGTKIVSDKPLSVVSGHECGIVPPRNNYCDHMVQQIPPSVTWGTSFMSMPFAKRNSGALFKMISHVPSNEVNITCNNVVANSITMSSLQLSADQISNYTITNDEWCSFVSEYPMLISQFAFGGEDETGDPLSMVLNPLQQYTDITLEDVIIPESPFADSKDGQKEHVVGIFVSGEMPENLTLDDNQQLDDLDWKAIYSGDDVLGYALSVDITQDSHFVSSSSSLPTLASVIVYGFTAELNAFGYPVNGALEPISCEF